MIQNNQTKKPNKKNNKKGKSSKLEAELFEQIKKAKLPLPVREFVAIPGRMFRWDFAWVKEKLLVEVQGGIYQKGAHSTGQGIERDMIKLNLATLNGYKVLQFSRRMIESGYALGVIHDMLVED